MQNAISHRLFCGMPFHTICFAECHFTLSVLQNAISHCFAECHFTPSCFAECHFTPSVLQFAGMHWLLNKFYTVLVKRAHHIDEHGSGKPAHLCRSLHICAVLQEKLQRGTSDPLDWLPTHIWAMSQENVFGDLQPGKTNQSAQLQKLARVLKLWIQQV